MTRNRLNEMVAADAIAGVGMIFFENHVSRGTTVDRLYGRRMMVGLRNLTGGTKEVVTRCAGDVESGGKEGFITEVDMIIGGRRNRMVPLAGDVLNGGDASMGDAMVP